MEKRTTVKKCKICKSNLNRWGFESSSVDICPDCIKIMRGAMVPCAGRCGKLHQLRLMEMVKLVFSPSQKGGKTIKLYYCESCVQSAKSKANSIFEKQQKHIKEVEKKLKIEKGKDTK